MLRLGIDFIYKLMEVPFGGNLILKVIILERLYIQLLEGSQLLFNVFL